MPSFTLIDTHCHLDAPEFDADRDAVREAARRLGVVRCVLAAVHPKHFARVRDLAHAWGDFYAVGIHPLYTENADENDLRAAGDFLKTNAGDAALAAVGEIGLDYFVPAYKHAPLRDKQRHFFVHQLNLAREFHRPVLLHSRRAVDDCLYEVRRSGTVGIAHAFSGSAQQAQRFLDLGWKLGFGGAFTHPRAVRLRTLARDLPLDAVVLETDAPDMPPRWLCSPGQPPQRNTPAELPRIAAELAALRGVPPETVAQVTTRTAVALLSRT